MQYQNDRRLQEERMLDEERRRRIAARRERARKKRRNQLIARMVLFCSALILLVLLVFGIKKAVANKAEEEMSYMLPDALKKVTEAPDFEVDLLDINEYSRPGIALTEVNGIVVHYTGNPGTTAAQNRSYFQSLAETGETKASSHFVVGLEGEIIQCVPCNEMSYASNERNCDTIAIECCISDETGKFNEKTYQSLIQLVAWLMGRYELSIDEVIRHYDVTGKECPRYYVKNPEAWEDFKEDVLSYIDTYGIEKSTEIY